MNILSNNIEVFPVAKPRIASSGQTNGGRLFTEYYVANIIRQLIGTNGFIINCSSGGSDAYGKSFEDLAASFTIEFNIDGYYFKIPSVEPSAFIEEFIDKNSTNLTNGNYYIVASLSGYDTSLEISGQDTKENGKTSYTYTGLDVSVQKIDDIKTLDNKSLILFNLIGGVVKKNDKKTLEFTEVTVHNESYQKFSAESMYITGIDGKYA